MLFYWLLIASLSTCSSNPTSDPQLDTVEGSISPSMERQIMDTIKDEMTAVQDSLYTKLKLEDTVEKLMIVELNYKIDEQISKLKQEMRNRFDEAMKQFQQEIHSKMDERIDELAGNFSKLKQELDENKDKVTQAELKIAEVESSLTLTQNKYTDTIEKSSKVEERSKHAIHNVSKLELEIENWKDKFMNLENYLQISDTHTSPKGINYQYEGGRQFDMQEESIIPESNSSALHHLLKLLVRSSCHDWKRSGFGTSGYYMIDPDGQGVGEPPYSVFCDMVTGFTFVHHDSETVEHVGPCSGSGCYKRSVNYNATEQQLMSLIKISQSCQQFIQLKCQQTPLQKEGELLSWWVDRHGDRQYYWSGDNDNGHTCACGLTGGCVDPRHVCNCNADMGNVLVTDKGYLTNTSILPVTELHFGDTSGNNKNMHYTLGPLRCFGERHLVTPESCEDVWTIGSKHSGYYFLGKEDYIRLQFCNMEKLDPKIADSQSAPVFYVSSLMNDVRLKHINNTLTEINSSIDTLKKSVIFNAVRTTAKTNADSYIVFDKVTVNIGDGYNSTTGKFTAMISGVYMFSTTTRKQTRTNTRINIKKNGDTITWAYSHSDLADNTFGSTVVTELFDGDEVGVELDHGKIEGYGSSSSDGVTLFLGVLLYT